MGQTLTWNSLGQLTQVVTNGATVTYGYDGLGRRIRRTGASTVQYVYDGDDLLFERDGSGALTEYTYYPGVDQPHSLKRGNSIHYYTQDMPGSVVGLIDSLQGLANEYRYTPWGELDSVWETVPNALGFQAREWDEGTGMYYFRNRWYDPQMMRFNSEDPIGLAGGLNLYGFAAGDPVNFSDPFGLCEKPNGDKGSVGICLRFKRCPTCGNEASGGLFGGVYINLHKCRRKGHYFCGECKNGDLCPNCGTDEISWNHEKAYTEK